METVFGDGSAAARRLLGTLLGAGKRLLTGESLFMTVFTNAGGGKQQVSFAAPYPGKILPMDLEQLGGELICQKDSFLCAARGVPIGIAFQRKLGVGLFGGEGFIMQRLDGDGLCFVHAGGTRAASISAPARRCASTPAASSRCSPASTTTSSSSAGSRTRSSAAKASSSPR